MLQNQGNAYLKEGKRENIGWFVFVSVTLIEQCHRVCIYAHNADVKFFHSTYLPE